MAKQDAPTRRSSRVLPGQVGQIFLAALDARVDFATVASIVVVVVAMVVAEYSAPDPPSAMRGVAQVFSPQVRHHRGYRIAQLLA
ncbi:MAG: hypothetical protein U0841_30995 [Chloroflexia bacterium]